jgi:hypothetical protein
MVIALAGVFIILVLGQSTADAVQKEMNCVQKSGQLSSLNHWIFIGCGNVRG